MRCAKRSLERTILLLAIPAFLASCATMPRVERGAGDYLDMLPPARTAYLSLDVTRTIDLVPLVVKRLGLKAGDLTGAAGRVRAVYAGVVLDPKAGPVFSAVIPGSFPRSCIRTSLGLKGARCVREGGEVWQEERKSGMQVSVPERGMIVISNGGIRDALAAYRSHGPAALPAEIVMLAGESDVVVFFPKVPGGAGSLGMPATPALLEIWAVANRLGEPGAAESAASVLLDVTLGFKLSGEREARLFRPVLKLLLLALERQGKLPGGAQALAATTDEVSGDVVRLRGLRITLAQAMDAVSGLVGGEAAAGGAP